MNEAEERKKIIAWIERAMEHAGATQAQLARAIWPNDRSILGKILKDKRRAQVAELAEIAAKTGYPPYLPTGTPTAKRDPMPRLKVAFHVREWRAFCQVSEDVLAKATKLPRDEYEFRESRPYKFSIEQLQAIAKALRVQFDSLRWDPGKLPAPEPADADIAKISKARGRK